MNLLALYFAATVALAADPKLPGHCYSSASDFSLRTIKILEVNSTEYKYMLFTQSEWFGILSNFKETIEVNYPLEVSCEKK